MRTPGAWPSVAQTSVDVGMLTSFSLENSVPTLVVDVSTIGDTPVTVTLSWSAATCSCMSTLSVVPTRSWMFSRTMVRKPGSSKVSVYVPDGRAANRYLPSLSVTAVRVPINAGDLAVTVAPGG